ncbi:MAG: DNA-3-methyladenine glycosylase [Thermoleophilia bacterium]
MVTAAPPRSLGAAELAAGVAELAPGLVGCTLLVDGVGGTIVETERYQHDDPASHSFRGPRGRAAIMFGPGGVLYVYRSYGIHWCANVVCGPEGSGEAVLLRAIAPERGVDAMRARRGEVPDRLLGSGPGRLTQALGIDAALDGAPIGAPGGRIEILPRADEVDLLVGPRIGISKAVDAPWRFGLAGSPHLSRPFPRA